MNLTRSLAVAGSLSAASLAFFAGAPNAAACGGCFHPPTDTPSIITDHRMALSVSTEQTVLWDQVRYSGAPSEFAWVLPVRPGTRVELSHDAWLAALDATTAPRIHPPLSACGGGAQGDTSGAGTGAGGCGSTSDETLDGLGGEDAGTYQSADGVQVESQEVVGPYTAVIIQSSNGAAIDRWLMDNGFAVPASLTPMLAAYTAEKFDFLALRLRPGQSTRAMQPVRVVTPGADPSLPLRMVAAGVGDHVGITLFVVSEGRYHPQNFPDVAIDESALQWDPATNQSNYVALTAAALASGARTGWLTEFSDDMPTTSQLLSGKTGLYDAYFGACAAEGVVPIACGSTGPQDIPGLAYAGGSDAGGNTDAGVNANGDAGTNADSGANGDGGASAEGGASADAGAGTDAGDSCVNYVSACNYYDDLDLAQVGIHGPELWVTRLRANLPAPALSRDLVLSATDQQTPVSNVHVAAAYTNPQYSPCGNSAKNGSAPGATGTTGCLCGTTHSRLNAGSLLLMLATALVVSATLRRRKR